MFSNLSQRTRRMIVLFVFLMSAALPTMACNDDVNIYKGACAIKPEAPACQSN